MAILTFVTHLFSFERERRDLVHMQKDKQNIVELKNASFLDQGYVNCHSGQWLCFFNNSALNLNLSSN